MPQPRNQAGLPPRPTRAERVGKALGKGVEGVPVSMPQGGGLPALRPTKAPAPSPTTPVKEEAAPSPTSSSSPKRKAPAKKKRKPTRYIRITVRDRFVLDYIRTASLVTATHVRKHLLLYPEHWTDGSALRSDIAGQIPAEVLEPSEDVVRKLLARLRRAKMLEVALVGNERIYAITREGLGALGYADDGLGAGAKRDPYREKLQHTLGIAALVSEVMNSLRKRRGFFAGKFSGGEEVAILTDAFIEKSSTFLKQDLAEVAQSVRQGWRDGDFGDPDFAIADAHAYALYAQGRDLEYRRLVPDLVVVTNEQAPWAVEFERTPKHDLNKYRDKLEAYTDSTFSDLFYITNVPGVRKRLERVLGELRWEQQDEKTLDADFGETVSVWVEPRSQTTLHLYTISKKKDRLYTETLPGMEGIIR